MAHTRYGQRQDGVCSWFRTSWVLILLLLVFSFWMLIQTEVTRSFSDKYVGNTSLSDITKIFGNKESMAVAQIGSLLRVEVAGIRSHISRDTELIENQINEVITRDESINDSMQQMLRTVRELLHLSSTNVESLSRQLRESILQNNNNAPDPEKLCFDMKDCPHSDCEDNDDDESECPPCDNSQPLITPESPVGVFYIVVGAESSGNRYTVSMLKAAGCVCQSGHVQPWDASRSQFSKINKKKLIEEHPACAAIHRSYPHDGQWVNLRSIMNDVVDAGYEPRIIHISRNALAVAQSQVRHKLAKTTTEAMMHITRAQREIYGYIYNSHVWFRSFQYEQYASPRYLEYVYKELGYKGGGGKEGIPAGHKEFKDMNSRYKLGT